MACTCLQKIFYLQRNKQALSQFFKIFQNSNHKRLYVQKTFENDSVVDTLDEFTTRLIQQKSEKWDSINISKNNLFELLKNPSKLNISTDSPKNNGTMNSDQFDLYIKNALQARDLNNLIILVNSLIENKIKLSYQTFLNLISFCAHSGERKLVEKLIDHGKSTEILDDSDTIFCKQYLAEAVWVSGNIHEAAEIFKNLYETHLTLRRNLSLLLRFLIGRTTDLRTEATLVQITILSENLNNIYSDSGPLICLWETCMLSDWFSDQIAALEMLERNLILRQYLARKFKVIIAKALKNNNTEVVQKFFELFLKFKMTEHYVPVLRILFDYYYWQRDFRHCAEIIRWSTNLNIPLRTEQNTKFLNLLLNQYGKDKTKNVVVKLNKPTLKPPQFKLKF